MSSVTLLKSIQKELTEKTQYPKKMKMNIGISVQWIKLIFEASLVKLKDYKPGIWFIEQSGQAALHGYDVLSILIIVFEDKHT